jgi:copper chaperone CopZ
MAVSNFSVKGMTCEHCERAVTNAVAALPGVDSVAVDLDGGNVRVDGQGFNDDAVKEAIVEAGYEVAG